MTCQNLQTAGSNRRANVSEDIRCETFQHDRERTTNCRQNTPLASILSLTLVFSVDEVFAAEMTPFADRPERNDLMMMCSVTQHRQGCRCQ